MQETPDITSAFRRLGDILAEEIQLLSNRSFDELAGITERKSRILLEITRLGREIPKEYSGSVSHEVHRVIELLEVNKRMLSGHLRAANSISQVIRATISDQSWDGTYASVIARQK